METAYNYNVAHCQSRFKEYIEPLSENIDLQISVQLGCTVISKHDII